MWRTGGKAVVKLKAAAIRTYIYTYIKQELEACRGALEEALVKLEAAAQEKEALMRDVDTSRFVLTQRDEAVK